MLPNGAGTDTKKSNELQKQVHTDVKKDPDDPIAKRQGKNAPPKKHHIASRKSGSTCIPKTTTYNKTRHCDCTIHATTSASIIYAGYTDTPIGQEEHTKCDGCIFYNHAAGRGTESAIRTAIDRGGQPFKEMIRGGK